MRKDKEAQPDGWPTRELRIAALEQNRVVLIGYMRMKMDAEDWHGVQDAASDLRDVDNELDGLRY